MLYNSYRFREFLSPTYLLKNLYICCCDDFTEKKLSVSMDLINGQTLVKADGTKVGATEGIAGKNIVCLYFSAHWCPPCRAFTPVLKDFYEVSC